MIVHTESRSLLLKTKNTQAIKNLLPKYQDINFEGHTIAVPHRLDEVRVLRNIGFNAPPPILYYYDWPSPPDKLALPHQKETAAFLTLYPRAFCFNQQGTMKTASALWAADYLMKHRQVRRAIINVPLTTVDVTWMEEIFAFMMHRRAVALMGSKKRRLELLATDCDFYVVNHHGMEVIAEELKGRHDIDLIITDECDIYRNSGTDLYETLADVSAKRRLWLMSGTPFPNAPTDAWALARLVDKRRVPQYFSQFRRQTMFQISQYKWIPRKDSADMAFNACQPAIRFKKEDCINLPPMVIVKRQAAMTPDQIAAFKDMKNKAVMEAKSHKIDAVNAADKINKLRQILCGVVKRPEMDVYVEIDHQPRIDALDEAIKQSATKAIVVVPFKGIISALERDLGMLGHSVEVINGDVSRTQRTEIITRFKKEDDPQVLLCHPKVMSHGLNLAEAATLIFYAPIYSTAEYLQVQDRIARPGQKHNMTIVRIACHHIEWEIYRILDERSVTQESILSLYRHEILGVE